MIHSARPTVSPVVNIVLALFCFAKFWKVGTDGRTTCAKTMIPIGRDCGSAELINIENSFRKGNLKGSSLDVLRKKLEKIIWQMNLSTRPTIPPLTINILTKKLFCLTRFWRKYIQMICVKVVITTTFIVGQPSGSKTFDSLVIKCPFTFLCKVMNYNLDSVGNFCEQSAE